MALHLALSAHVLHRALGTLKPDVDERDGLLHVVLDLTRP